MPVALAWDPLSRLQDHEPARTYGTYFRTCPHPPGPMYVSQTARDLETQIEICRIELLDLASLRFHDSKAKPLFLGGYNVHSFDVETELHTPMTMRNPAPIRLKIVSNIRGIFGFDSYDDLR